MRRKRKEGTNLQRNHENPERSFGLLFGVVFGAIGLFPLFDGILSWASVRWWSIVVAVVFFLVAIIRPSYLTIPNRLWREFGTFLGRIISSLVMGFMFFVILTPIAVLKRLLGGSSLPLKPDTAKESYWTILDRSESVNDMENQF